jgi:hypothetical protein
MQVSFSVEGLPQLRVIDPDGPVQVRASDVANRALTLGMPIEQARAGMHEIVLTARNDDGETLNTVETRFFVPASALEDYRERQ